MNKYHVVYKDPNKQFASGITIEGKNPLNALEQFKKNNNIEWFIAIYRVDNSGYLSY